MAHRAQLYEYKGNRCACCGIAVQEMVARYGTFNRMFQFHHVEPTSKDKHYKRLMSQRLSRRQMDEIDKCVLLCTLCHATIHAQEIKGTLRLSVDFNGRLVSQTFSGWIRADGVARKLNFVTNEPYLLHPCVVRLNGGHSIHMCANEVEAALHAWLGAMAQHKSIEVTSLRDRRVVLKIQHLDGPRISVQQEIGFPSLALELHAHNDPGEVMYIRNGFALMASGATLSAGMASYTVTLSSDGA